MTTTPTKTPKSRRRWLQSSLRTMMIVALAGGVSCAWLAERMNHARHGRFPTAFVRELGGYEFYDFQRWADGSIPLMAPKVALVTPTLRSRLQSLLDDDLFRTVVRVDFQVDRLLSDSDLKTIIGGLPALEELHLNDTELTDEGILELQRLASLRVLELRHRDLNNPTVANLRRWRPDLTILRSFDGFECAGAPTDIQGVEYHSSGLRVF